MGQGNLFSSYISALFISIITNKQNSTTKQEIESLVSSQNYSELESRLMNRMEFGTAGLRSRMGAGYTMMNDLTIIQTGQGFLEYLKKHFGQERLIKSGIVVGYDARHNSSRFARLTANIFLKANVPVYLFRQINMTPFVVRPRFIFFTEQILTIFVYSRMEYLNTNAALESWSLHRTIPKRTMATKSTWTMELK